MTSPKCSHNWIS